MSAAPVGGGEMTADLDLAGLREKAEKASVEGYWDRVGLVGDAELTLRRALDPTTILALIARVEKAEELIDRVRWSATAHLAATGNPAAYAVLAIVGTGRTTSGADS